MEIKAVLFDKDGTLIDFEDTFAPALAGVINELSKGDKALATSLAHSVEFDLHNLSFDINSIVIAGTNFDVANAFASHLQNIDAFELSNNLDEMFERHSAASVTALEGLENTLTSLNKMDLPLGIATNDTEENARLHMQTLGTADQFAFYAGYNSGHGAKPEPGMILAFAEQFGLQPQNIAMVGDSVHDLKTANNAGAIGIGVLTGLADKEELTPHANFILDSINQLPEFIARKHNIVS